MADDSGDYYGDSGGGDDSQGMDGGMDADAKKPSDNKEMDEDTTLLPKSLFKGKIPEVGETCQFKVEHIWENEVEVSWVDGSGDGKKSTMDTATDAFDQMASPMASGGMKG